jgi:RES domain-containing protein
MFVYRVANKKYKGQTLSGIGAEKVGGRWNEIGTRAVYCSENISLALLEYYVHSENIASLPKDILIAQIQIPSKFEIIELDRLPPNWSSFPYSSDTTKVFTDLAKDRNFFGLKVPSSIIGLEYNYILNPLYKEFGKIEVDKFITLPIDKRLKESKRV